MFATIAASASLRSRRAPLAAARSTNSWIAGNVSATSGGESRIVWRNSQRHQSVNLLAFNPERLATGRKNMDLGRIYEDARRKSCDRIDEMFATVEDQKHFLVAQIRN